MSENVRKVEPLFQVMATERKTGQLVAMPMFPRVMKETADEYVQTVKMMIAAGKEKRYADPHVAQLLTNSLETSLEN
jgi:hypothetical protein